MDLVEQAFFIDILIEKYPENYWPAGDTLEDILPDTLSTAKE